MYGSRIYIIYVLDPISSIQLLRGVVVDKMIFWNPSIIPNVEVLGISPGPSTYPVVGGWPPMSVLWWCSRVASQNFTNHFFWWRCLGWILTPLKGWCLYICIWLLHLPMLKAKVLVVAASLLAASRPSVGFLPGARLSRGEDGFSREAAMIWYETHGILSFFFFKWKYRHFSFVILSFAHLFANATLCFLKGFCDLSHGFRSIPATFLLAGGRLGLSRPLSIG